MKSYRFYAKEARKFDIEFAIGSIRLSVMTMMVFMTIMLVHVIALGILRKVVDPSDMRTVYISLAASFSVVSLVFFYLAQKFSAAGPFAIEKNLSIIRATAVRPIEVNSPTIDPDAIRRGVNNPSKGIDL